MMRRVAAHHVDINGKTLNQCVVEIQDGKVVNYYTFTDELPLTEWLGGTITIVKNEENMIVAEWKGRLLK